MSTTSDDDSDFLESSPAEVTSRATRRRANSPSPKKYPRKKQREVLSSYNEAGDSDDDEEEQKGNKGRRGVMDSVQQGKRKIGNGTANTTSDEDSEKHDKPKPKPVLAEKENVRGSSTSGVMSNGSVFEDNSQPVNNADAQSRTRKRLSIRSDYSTDRRSTTSGVSSTVESVTSASEVQSIYETCSQMFNANRINPQNAFNLKLLDCINQMINSPTYDKSNMQLTSSTVEIGTKIYVCRVENAHSQVLSLASDINLQQRRKKKDGAGNDEEGNMEGQDDPVNMVDEDDEPLNAGKRLKLKKRTGKKRGKFVEDDNSKLLTGLEEQNVKYVSRRNILKKKFTDMIYENMEFDYMGHFLEPEVKHPLQVDEEKKNMESQFRIPETYINPLEVGRLNYLPFVYLSQFDSETHTIWGLPLSAAEDARNGTYLPDTNLPEHADFAYDPASRPAEYPEEALMENDINDTFAERLPPIDGDDDAGDELRPVSFHEIQSLDNLEEYFKRIKNLIKESRSKFGWCGPTFARPKNAWNALNKGQRKPRTRKEPERIDFTKADWNNKNNKFNINSAARTVFDDKVIEAWSTSKVIIPFLGVELSSYDDDFDPVDFENENDPKYMPPIFKLFTCRNRSILDMVRAKGTRAGPSSEALLDQVHDGDGDDGFDNDHDIELPRDNADVFCAEGINDNVEAYGDNGCTGPSQNAWPFVSSLANDLLNGDPLSQVSGVDSIRFSKKPKPIDMSALKKAILKTLVIELKLTETGLPLVEEETKIDLATLMYLVLQSIGSKTEKLLSVSIFVVALMHVVAERRLFVIYDDSDIECPVIICRGNKFNHKDHIPMPDAEPM